MSKPIKVLIAKPGLDGHDVGAKLVCRALKDAGMEVIYTGLRQSPRAIADAALEEDVDAVGLSILSGAHVPLCRKLKDEMAKRKIENKVWFVGGNIPRPDFQVLKDMGVNGIFPTGSTFEQLVDFLKEKVKK